MAFSASTFFCVNGDIPVPPPIPTSTCLMHSP